MSKYYSVAEERKHEYFLSENSGYTRGTGWFDDKKQYDTFEEAEKANKKQQRAANKGGKSGILFRVTKVISHIKTETFYRDKSTYDINEFDIVEQDPKKAEAIRRLVLCGAIPRKGNIKLRK